MFEPKSPEVLCKISLSDFSIARRPHFLAPLGERLASLLIVILTFDFRMKTLLELS